VTVGYSNFKVNNDIDPLTADSIRLQNYLNDVTNQFSISSNYDLRLNVLHRLFLNIVTSRKQDYTQKNLWAKFFVMNFSIQNFWTKNFTTFLGTTISNSEISISKYSYTSINLGSRVNLLNNKYRATFSITPFFGSLKRTIVDLFNQYYIRQNLSLNLNIRYLFNVKPVEKDETILNLFAQYEL